MAKIEYSDDGKTLIQAEGVEGHFVIPEGVTSIGAEAFSGCEGLTSITIPSSVTAIGGGAFEGCTGLTSIVIPSSVTSIGEDAFSGCTGLTSVEIPDSVASIDDGAFDGCTALTAIGLPAIPSIGYGAFRGCTALTSIVIPESVKGIRWFAFKRSGLKQLHMQSCRPDEIVLVDDAFEGIFGQCTLYVPAGSADAYRQHPVFGKFKEIIEE